MILQCIYCLVKVDMENSNIITGIESQKRNKNRVNVYIDYEFAFSCSTELVYSKKIAKGDSFNEDELKCVIEEDNFIRCKDDALKTIERVYKSEKEITDKLITKGYEPQTVQRVMDFLRKYSFLNDEKYAEMYINERLKYEGIQKIRYALMRKGISQDIIDKKAESVNSDASIGAALSLAQKKYNLLKRSEEDERKVMRKLSEYLYRKGFSQESIRSVLKSISSNFEDSE